MWFILWTVALVSLLLGAQKKSSPSLGAPCEVLLSQWDCLHILHLQKDLKSPVFLEVEKTQKQKWGTVLIPTFTQFSEIEACNPHVSSFFSTRIPNLGKIMVQLGVSWEVWIGLVYRHLATTAGTMAHAGIAQAKGPTAPRIHTWNKYGENHP